MFSVFDRKNYIKEESNTSTLFLPLLLKKTYVPNMGKKFVI